MNNYLIYKHTSPSGKSYIGQTNNYKRRCNSHKSQSNTCRIFANAIKKYTWDAFTHEILHENLSIDQANELEAIYILEHNTLSPNGYNLHTGGKNYKVSSETRVKLSLASRGRITKEETRVKLSLAMTQERKDLVALSNKNRVWTEESKAKMAATKKNMPAKTKIKMANSQYANSFNRLKEIYLQLELTETTYSINKIATLFSADSKSIKNHLKPTVCSDSNNRFIITLQQIHDYFNQPNPYLTLNT